MAINIKNYVDITTQFPQMGAGGRSLGGLVFTSATANVELADPDSELHAEYEAYNNGDVIALDVGKAGLFFGIDSDEANFANGYYSYLSPSGRFASTLQFAKILETDQTKTDAFIRVNEITNMFGSFTFLSGGGRDSGASTPDDSELKELQAVAIANAKYDTKYLFVVNDEIGSQEASTIAEKASTYFSAIRGVCFVAGKFNWSAYMPMAILAATDYDNSSVTNFMFKQFSTEDKYGVAVASDADYKIFNKACVNFYGQTQTNGQTLNFFQRGFNTDGMDTAIYCNELWFKSICETALLTMLSGKERLSADTFGVDTVKLEIEECCAPALNNGMFMPKEVSRKEYSSICESIARTGGSSSIADAISADLSSKGYGIYAFLERSTDAEKFGPGTEYFIRYFVFYGTADSVRYIKGNNILL